MIFTKKKVNVFVIIVIFFYIYRVTFVFIPISTFYIYSFIGLSILVIQLSFRPYISIKFTKYLYFYSLIFLFSFISIIINLTFDIVFLRNIFAFVFFIFASIFVLTITKEHIQNNNDIIRYFCIACTVQSIITIFSFFNPVFREILRNIQIFTEIDAAKYEVLTYRAYGLGSWFDVGSVTLGFSLILIQYLYLQEKKYKFFYIIIFLIQLLAGMLTARTIIVGFGFSALFLFTAPKEYNKRKFLAIRDIILVILAFIVLLFIFFPKFIETYYKTIQWAFRLFFSIASGGKTRVGSLDILFGRMYFLPDSVRTFIIGDGLIVNQDGSYYMHTDAGYMRLYLFFGILGLLSYIIYQIYLGVNMFGKNENILLRNLKYILIIYTLICFIKFRANIAPVASLFFALNYMLKPEIKSLISWKNIIGKKI